MIVACSPRKTNAKSRASTKARPSRLATKTWPSVGRHLDAGVAKWPRLPRPSSSAEPRLFLAGDDGLRLRDSAATPPPALQPFEHQIDDRSGVERQHLRNDEASNDGDAERSAQLRAHPMSNCKGNGAKKRRHGRHHDRPEADDAGLVDRVLGRKPLLAFGLEGKIHHHDGV